MANSEVIHCQCCRMKYNVPVPPGADLPELCRSCYEHRGTDEHMRLRRAEDHENLYRLWWEKARDAAVEMSEKVARYRDKTVFAYRSRDHAVRVLRKVADQHHPTARGCSCGKRPDCPTARVIDTGWVMDRIRDLEKREREEEVFDPDDDEYSAAG